MFSGNDSTESQNYTQWPLNASAYQSMQNEQVDWAALAHQWIKMKEAGPPLPDKTPTAPPPPVISAASPTKGEAPMDVENDSDSNNMGSDSNDGLQWNPQQPSNWNSWSNTAWPPAVSSVPMNKAPLLPTPAYNAFSTNVKEDNNFSATPAQNPGYWSGNGSPARTSSSAPRIMKPHNKRFSKVNVPLKTAPQAPHIGPNAGTTTTSVGEASPPIIDANKRKQLPAWIREGLEKMERDKLKQIDKYRQKDRSDEIEEEKKKLRENALEILKNTARENEKPSKPFGEYGHGSPLNDSGEEEEDQQPPTPPHITQPSATVALTQEELMLKVRRMMTEILLKVTNREISQICKEEHQRHVRKLKANDQRVSAPSAGANLSARLGLGAYGSGESSDDSGGEDEKTEIDSDNELKETIRRRKEEFEKVERAIQNRLAQVEAEKEGESNKDRRVSPESDGGSKQTPEKTQDRRSRTPKSTKRGSKRSVQASSKSRSTTSSSSSSSDRRYSSRRSSRDRRRRSPSSSKRRSNRRKYSRSRSRSTSRSRSSRSYRSDRRRDSRSSRRSRSRSPSRSRRRSRRRTRSRTRSRSRDAGRGRVGVP